MTVETKLTRDTVIAESTTRISGYASIHPKSKMLRLG